MCSNEIMTCDACGRPAKAYEFVVVAGKPQFLCGACLRVSDRAASCDRCRSRRARYYVRRGSRIELVCGVCLQEDDIRQKPKRIRR